MIDGQLYDRYGWKPDRVDLANAQSWALANDPQSHQRHLEAQWAYDSIEGGRNADLHLVAAHRRATDPELRDSAALTVLTLDNQRRANARHDRVMTGHDLLSTRQRITAQLTPSGRAALKHDRQSRSTTAQARDVSALLHKITERAHDPHWHSSARTTDLIQDWRTLTAARAPWDVWNRDVEPANGTNVPAAVDAATSRLNAVISERVGLDWETLEAVAASNIHPAVQTVSPRAHLDAVLAAGGDLVDHGVLHHPDRQRTLDLVEAADEARGTSDPSPGKWGDVDAAIIRALSDPAVPSGVTYAGPSRTATYSVEVNAEELVSHFSRVLLRNSEHLDPVIVWESAPTKPPTLAEAQAQGQDALYAYYYQEREQPITEIAHWGWTGGAVDDGPMTAAQVETALRDYARYELDPETITVATADQDGRHTTYRVDIATTPAQHQAWTDKAQSLQAEPISPDTGGPIAQLQALHAASFPASPLQSPASPAQTLRPAHHQALTAPDRHTDRGPDL